MKRLRLTPVLFTVAALASCDGGTGPVTPVPTTVVAAPSAVSLVALGATERVTATVRDQEGSIMGATTPAWASEDPAIASVAADGLITAVAVGSTSVTATAGSAVGAVAVTVSQEAVTLTLGQPAVTLADPGDTVAVAAEALDALGSNLPAGGISWSSSNDAIATVDANGVVTAVGTGQTEVTATAGSLSMAVTVRVAPELTIVAVGSGPIVGAVATTLPLSARVESMAAEAWAGGQVLWSTGAGSGAIVSTQVVESDESGYVGAVWQLDTIAGTQRAFAQIETRGQTVVVEFLATAQAGAATTASFVADTVLLSAVGETAFLAPTFADEYGNTAEATTPGWTSSDGAVVSVSTDGLITGTGVGSAWVTASLAGPVDSVEVTVALRGAITITFDDGWRSVYDNAFPLMEEFGFRGNVGVYTEVVGAPAYMTEAHLDELHDAGWSMPSHTVTHDSLPTLTVSELDFQLQASKAWLDARGYRGTNVFIAPYHEFEDRERLAASTYYTAARGQDAPIDSLTMWRPDNPYRLGGVDALKLPFTTAAGRDALRAFLQRAIDDGSFIDLYFHMMPLADVPALRATLEVVDDFRHRVVPYHELYPLFARTVF